MNFESGCEFRRSQRTIGSDIIAVTIIDGKRVMVDPQTLKPLDAVPIAHPEPKFNSDGWATANA